jgi:histone acetyltransferase MYST1
MTVTKKKSSSKVNNVNANTPVSSTPNQSNKSNMKSIKSSNSSTKNDKKLKKKSNELGVAAHNLSRDSLELKDVPESNDGIDIGKDILVRYRDGSCRKAKVIEISKQSSNTSDENVDANISYYVHYHDFNRRMDEWIRSDRIISTNIDDMKENLNDSNGK